MNCELRERNVSDNTYEHVGLPWEYSRFLSVKIPAYVDISIGAACPSFPVRALRKNVIINHQDRLLVCVTVKFHIAHLYEVQGKYRLAKEHYEALLKGEKALPSHLKADICRQLGKSPRIWDSERSY